MLETNCEFFLMHKNVVVAKLNISKENGNILDIKEVLNQSHIPICVSIKNKDLLESSINIWWANRCIPYIRPGLNDLLRALGFTTAKEMLIKSYGLSLSDQYWICPSDDLLRWEDVNFFENPFSNDFGELLLGKEKITKKTLDLKSPDIATDGELPKMWTFNSSKKFLVKGGSFKYLQEPLNEVIASKIMDKLNIPHVRYDLIWENTNGIKTPFSICECFVNTETEFISEDHFTRNKIQEKPDSKSFYQFYIDCCKDVGLNNAQSRVDQMIVVDFLIANQDRHTNNFGLIRNAKTLEFIDVAPIFDSGNSLWYDKLDEFIPNCKDFCKPYANRHYKQIKLTSISNWPDIELLNGFEEEIKTILNQSPFISEQRQIIICDNFKNRLRLLQKYVKEKNKNPDYDPEFDDEFNPQKENIFQDNPEDTFDPFENFIK